MSIFFLALLSFNSFKNGAFNINPENHQNIIDGSRTAYAQTQNLSIKEQLNSGIRYFDIRTAWHSSKKVHIVHNIIDCMDEDGKTLFFSKVLKDCSDFLSSHNSETIILHLTIQENNEANQSLVIDQVNNNIDEYIKNKKMYNVNDGNNKNRIPTLNEVRGKIVILSRRYGFDGIYLTIPEESDDVNYVETECINKNYKCITQDAYKLGESSKLKAITKLINRQNNLSEQGSENLKMEIVINFFNIEYSIFGDSIKTVSYHFKNELIDGNKLTPNKQHGWIVVDYADKDIASYIYKTNKFYDGRCGSKNVIDFLNY
ncbi:PLC-like phosphodiesterase [Anaeromyces robustus]|uniref:PLC-like phosphodiesterase n=1 Tax=Anaeromyces robustus TaxID=1754192 RepID=A0A1Y1X115_9FUNG|nr:PLC-like phosphodiesterase [Anaeromyces robustus]|eukprot:ORX79355.1 PLC-like phosphodiesterase [Anaeromyces robustus]